MSPSTRTADAPCAPFRRDLPRPVRFGLQGASARANRWETLEKMERLVSRTSRPPASSRVDAARMPFGHHKSPPSSAPARLAVGFGPKELSPTLQLRAIHPKDLPGPLLWVPRPRSFFSGF